MWMIDKQPSSSSGQDWVRWEILNPRMLEEHSLADGTVLLRWDTCMATSQICKVELQIVCYRF